jgi:hypothetical protein
VFTWPVPFGRGNTPAINDVTDKIEIIAMEGFKKIGKLRGLATPRAKVNI